MTNKLKTIDEYHAEIAAAARAARATGVACPECGGELLWCEYMALYGTDRLARAAKCEKCSLQQVLECPSLNYYGGGKL